MNIFEDKPKIPFWCWNRKQEFPGFLSIHRMERRVVAERERSDRRSSTSRYATANVPQYCMLVACSRDTSCQKSAKSSCSRSE